MTAITCPSDEDLYLLAILTDPSGVDAAEFSWTDPVAEHGRYRVWNEQQAWYHCDDMFQISQGARSVGKTVSITMRAWTMPFRFPGQSMLLTAPELNHLQPLTSAIEDRILQNRLTRELLPKNSKTNGINKTPHWQCSFVNGTKLISRLPNLDGRGVKSMHVTAIELDEAQNYGVAGYAEIVETLNRGQAGAMWRCIAAGQLVLTRDGWVPIEKVQVGDEVWTHRGHWKRVLTVYDNGFTECVSVSGQGHFGLEMTANHKVWSAARQGRSRALMQPDWVPVGQVDGARWASPTNVTNDRPVPAMQRKARSRHAGTVDTRDLRWLWLYGLYLAEGYTCQFPTVSGRTSRRTHWCLHRDEVPHVRGLLTDLGLSTHLYEVGLSVKVIVNGQQVHDWMDQNAGRLATGKEIAPWVFGLDDAGRRAVFDGMLYGDGSYSQSRQRSEYGTSSRALAFGVKLLAQSLGQVANVQLKPAHVSVIEGRVVQTKDHYVIQITDVRPKVQTLMADDMAWGLVRSADVQPVGVRHVFDLEVEDDHSYVVEGIVVSNCHGVPVGFRDKFYDMTEGAEQDANVKWTVHRPMAFMKPTWSDEERADKIHQYGGSRQNIDYKRNIYGEHGSASHVVFVLSRLIAATDIDTASVYNTEVYKKYKIEEEDLPNTRDMDESEAMFVRQDYLEHLIYIPAAHKEGWSMKVNNKEVGALKGYSAYWAGMDVGLLAHPSEILVFGQRKETDHLDLLLRLNIHRLKANDQKFIVQRIFELYGKDLKIFAMDSTGLGQPIFQDLCDIPAVASRIKGYNFSENRVVGFEDRELQGKETKADLAIMRNVVEAATDWLRNDYVDTKRILLPYDKELLQDFQSQTYSIVKDNGSPYGKRRLFGGGASFHALDAAKMAIAGKHFPPLEAMLNEVPVQADVFDQFIGDMDGIW